jgi:hypothetical protein
MPVEVNEFIAEQRRGLKELVRGLRKSRIEATRKAARESAARIRSLNERVRSLARSGVRVSAASQGAVQDLLQLQEEIVTSALTDAAGQIERLAYTESLRDFARAQAEVLRATRQRIVDDIGRAMKGLRSAAGELRRSVVQAETPARRAKPRKTAARKKTTTQRRAAPKSKASAVARKRARARSRARR